MSINMAGGVSLFCFGAALLIIGASAIGSASRPVMQIDTAVALSLVGTINNPTEITPKDVAIPIVDNGKEIDVLTVYMDGHVEFGQGFTADDGAKEFWRLVEKYKPEGLR